MGIENFQLISEILLEGLLVEHFLGHDLIAGGL
jgi:hypothetical protein